MMFPNGHNIPLNLKYLIAINLKAPCGKVDGHWIVMETISRAYPDLLTKTKKDQI